MIVIQHECHLAAFHDGRGWPGVEVENESPWHFRLLRLTIPGMKLKGGAARPSMRSISR